MAAMHLSKAHAPWANRGVWVGLILMASSCLALGTETTAQTEPITAVYKAQELTFSYRASQYYSCQELQHRVAVIMVAVGARDDIDVTARNCDVHMVSGGDMSMDIDPYGRDTSDPFGRDRNDPFGRDQNDPWNRNSTSGGFRRPGSDRQQSVQVRIRAMMPVELTPKIQAEIEKDRSRRELVSRVTRNPAASMNDPVVFAARRQEVTLSQRTIKLQAEDCELLQQMTTQVIRRLGVQVKDQSFGCGPRTSSRIPPQLTVETLVPTGAMMPMPNPEKKTPAPSSEGSNGSGSSSSEPSEPETRAAEPAPQ